MSSSIQLDEVKGIRQWIRRHPLEPKTRGFMTVEELIAEEEEDADCPECANHDYWVVEHTLGTGDGSPLITLVRVYRARDAEDALMQYAYGPSRHHAGRGTEYVDVTLRDSFNHLPQQISVYKLAGTTDSLW